MSLKHAKILPRPVIFSALCCFLLFFSTAKSQTNSFSSFPAQNFHQWGALTLFNGLPSDTVRAIAQTADGIIWFGTDNGLARFDGRRVQRAPMEEGETGKILALEVSPKGDLWVGTENGAFQYGDGKFIKIGGTRGFAITAFFFGENTLLATEGGEILKLSEAAGNAFQIEKIPAEPLIGSDGQLLKITSLAEIGGRKIAGTRSRSILVIENDRAPEIFGKPRPFFINALVKNSRGKIWLGADSEAAGSGLFSLEDISQPQRIGEGLGNVLSLRPDNGGSLWVGTQNNGLFHFRDNGEQLEQFTFENTAGGLRSNTVYALLVDRDGVVWIGTNRGVCRYDASSPLNKMLSDKNNSNFVRAFFKTADGRIFAGTNRGLFEFLNGSWIETQGFSQKAIYTIGEDLSNRLLIGTSNGLFDFDGKQKMTGDVRSIANFQGKIYIAVFGRGVIQLDSQAPIASDAQPTTLFADAGKLWIGTAKNGIFSFDGKETKKEETLNNLEGGAVRKIMPDAGHNLWLAGEGGLFLYKDGQPENIISRQILRDVVIGGSGDVWAATEEGGLLHLKRDEVFGWLAANLNVEQGLPSQKTFSLLPLGDHLLIGTNRGVVEYVPGANPPKIVPVRILSQRLHAPEELAQTIALNYPQNSLLVEAAGLSSRTFPEQFQYGFLLKNSKAEILEKKLSTEPQFTAANLPAGEYSIEARVFDKDLIASEPLTIKFSVAAAPFPAAATALGVLLAIALIALIWAIIERHRIAQRNRELAAARFDLANEAERERKRIARDLHDQTLADLRTLMLMSDKLPADNSEFRAEIESVSTEIRRICEDLSPSVLENVGLLAALEFLLNQTIENRKFSADELEEDLNFSSNVQMQIYRIAQEVLTNIKRHGNARFVEMKINISAAEGFILSVEDDGTFFNPAPGASAKGRGIGNIKSRAALIKAGIGWQESAAGGTVFTLKKSI